jgi:hypothetical protein
MGRAFEARSASEVFPQPVQNDLSETSSVLA